MTSPPALGAVSGGIRYQSRFFWLHAVQMLAPDPRVLRVVLEHPGIGVVDDVVVYYSRPGLNDAGQRVSVDFFQLKFHVAQNGSVSAENLIDPDWTGTKESMLKRFADSWRDLKDEHANPRLSLVTNWVWHPECPLAAAIRHDGRLKDEFLTKGSKSILGTIREEWHSATGLKDDEFRAFTKALRFRTSAVSQQDTELWLIDRCQLAGLVPVQHGQDHSPYDDLAARFLETGRTEHTPETLRQLVEEQGLVAVVTPPLASTLAIRSFSRFAAEPPAEGAIVVDLTEHFDGRHPKRDQAWGHEIRDALDSLVPQAADLAQPVNVALDAHLSIAWYAGFLLDPKAGIHAVLRQRVLGRGIELWDLSATPPNGAETWVIETEGIGEGEELALVISVTHSALTDAMNTIRASLPQVGTFIHAQAPKLGPRVIADGAHARWLAEELIRLSSAQVAHKRPSHVHVFAACPVSLAFLLGQESRVLGPATIYEFNFGGSDRGYAPGMTTLTDKSP
ncbi:MAG: SAVED domain-containing protein [Proteobacteria bacterium]|nr:SAVED domain-containing protein [Pseudomonadota bacterium]